MMGLGSIEIAEAKAAQGGAPVYLYNFGYKSEAKIPGTDYPMGTPHAADIAFKFNNVESPIRSPAAGRSDWWPRTTWPSCGRPSPAPDVRPRLGNRRGPPTISLAARRCASIPSAK